MPHQCAPQFAGDLRVLHLRRLRSPRRVTACTSHDCHVANDNGVNDDDGRQRQLRASRQPQRPPPTPARRTHHRHRLHTRKHTRNQECQGANGTQRDRVMDDTSAACWTTYASATGLSLVACRAHWPTSPSPWTIASWDIPSHSKAQNRARTNCNDVVRRRSCVGHYDQRPRTTTR